MEFKEELTGPPGTVTSSSDVTDAGALPVTDANQQTGSNNMAPVVL